MFTPNVTCPWFLIKSVPEYVCTRFLSYVPLLFFFVLTCPNWAQTTCGPFVEMRLGWDFPFCPLPFNSFSSLLQESDSAAVGALRFHVALYLHLLPACAPCKALWAWRVCLCACLIVCMGMFILGLLCLHRNAFMKEGTPWIPSLLTPPASLFCHSASIGPDVSNLQALIGVMCCRWGNSKHYWTFPVLGRRSCGFGPGRVQFGPHSRTLLAQKESWQIKHPPSYSPASKQD